MNMPLLLKDIQTALNGADRPEFNLMQRYESSSGDQKVIFVCALIGKLIEQDRMLRARNNCADGLKIKE